MLHKTLSESNLKKVHPENNDNSKKKQLDYYDNNSDDDDDYDEREECKKNIAKTRIENQNNAFNLRIIKSKANKYILESYCYFSKISKEEMINKLYKKTAMMSKL